MITCSSQLVSRPTTSVLCLLTHFPHLSYYNRNDHASKSKHHLLASGNNVLLYARSHDHLWDVSTLIKRVRGSVDPVSNAEGSTR